MAVIVNADGWFREGDGVSVEDGYSWDIEGGLW